MSKKLIHVDSLGSLDARFEALFWMNKSKQTHYFEQLTPGALITEPATGIMRRVPPLPEQCPKLIVAPPGKATYIPHGYYKISSRDNSKLVGAWVRGECIEELSESSLTHGNQAR